jgi:hypothetical protein
MLDLCKGFEISMIEMVSTHFLDMLYQKAYEELDERYEDAKHAYEHEDYDYEEDDYNFERSRC